MAAKQIVRLHFKLEPRGVVETVEVASAAPLLQSESTTVEQVSSTSTLNNLSLNGRNSG